MKYVDIYIQIMTHFLLKVNDTDIIIHRILIQKKDLNG